MIFTNCCFMCSNKIVVNIKAQVHVYLIEQ